MFSNFKERSQQKQVKAHSLPNTERKEILKKTDVFYKLDNRFFKTQMYLQGYNPSSFPFTPQESTYRNFSSKSLKSTRQGSRASLIDKKLEDKLMNSLKKGKTIDVFHNYLAQNNLLKPSQSQFKNVSAQSSFAKCSTKDSFRNQISQFQSFVSRSGNQSPSLLSTKQINQIQSPSNILQQTTLDYLTQFTDFQKYKIKKEINKIFKGKRNEYEDIGKKELLQYNKNAMFSNKANELRSRTTLSVRNYKQLQKNLYNEQRKQKLNLLNKIVDLKKKKRQNGQDPDKMDVKKEKKKFLQNLSLKITAQLQEIQKEVKKNKEKWEQRIEIGGGNIIQVHHDFILSKIKECQPNTYLQDLKPLKIGRYFGFKELYPESDEEKQ